MSVSRDRRRLLVALLASLVLAGCARRKLVDPVNLMTLCGGCVYYTYPNGCSKVDEEKCYEVNPFRSYIFRRKHE